MKKSWLIPFLLVSATSHAEIKLTTEEVFVTASRYNQKPSEIPYTINTATSTEATSTADALKAVPGVAIAGTSGTMSLVGIRLPALQPTSPSVVHAYDGIPFKSAGWFNAYKPTSANYAQADRIEIIKGPTSTMFGSDAIGGVINVISKRPPATPQGKITGEIGSYNHSRIMAEGGTSGSDWGIYATTSFLNTDTFRDDENHKQQHFSVRFDKYLSNNDMLKTIIVYGNADLTGISGPMRLREADYRTNKALNYYPISYIDTSSLIVATTYEKEWAKSSISITPFYRQNGFETIINNNPVTNNYVFKDQEKSYGINTRFRHDFDTWKTRLNTGVDMETNPGSYQERVISITRETLSSGATRALSYTETGAMNYDYKATYSSISPYAQTEFSPFQSIPLRFTTGIRYDYVMWDYQNKLSTKTTGCVFSNGLVCRPESTDLEFSRASPKLGVVYNINKQHDIFANYSEGFRSPYHSNLFRSGANSDTINLQPIVAKQKEIGIRGNTNTFAYSLSLFDIVKTNDIIFARNPDTTIAATNSGKTSHTGVEVSTALQLTNTLKTNVSYTYIKHKYDYWVSSNVDFSGKDMEGAPREISNVALIYTPTWLKGGSVMGEWYHASDMYGNSANVIEGKGGKYDIFNIKANYFVTPKVELFTRVLNATDKDYTNSITYNSTTSQKEYFVAPPRTIYFGATYHF